MGVLVSVGIDESVGVRAISRIYKISKRTSKRTSKPLSKGHLPERRHSSAPDPDVGITCTIQSHRNFNQPKSVNPNQSTQINR